MENEEKYIKTEEDEENLTCIKDILSDYYNETKWSYDEKTGVFSFPIGLLLFEKGTWIVSPTLTMITEPFDIFILMSLVKDIAEEDIDIEIEHGSHLVFNEEGICTGCVPQCAVYKYAHDNGVEEDEAFSILMDVESTKNKISDIIH